MNATRLQTLRVDEVGLSGTLFTPVGQEPEAAALVIGGSGGNEPSWLGEPLADAGILALSVAYFSQPGLPPELSKIHLEYFQAALGLLKAQVAPRRVPVVLLGQSRGSEAALLTAIHSADLVDAVVVSVPGNVSLCAYPAGGPAWMLNGSALPYTDEFGPECANPAALIPVEQVAGPIMFISAGADEIWPSAAMARAMSERLSRHGDRHGHELLEYPDATHSLGYLRPVLPPGLLPADPSEPTVTQSSRADAWPQVLRFILQSSQT